MPNNLSTGMFTLLITLTLLLGISIGGGTGVYIGSKMGDVEHQERIDDYKNLAYNGCKAKSLLTEPQQKRRECEYLRNLDQKEI